MARKTTVRDGVVTELTNAKDAIAAKRRSRVTVTNETARDPLNEHAAKQGLGNLPGIRTDAKGNVLEQTVQADPKTVNSSELVMDKADMKLAEDTVKQFQGEADKYTSLKEKLETAKGGLSTIMLHMAKHARTRMAEHPQYTLAMFLRMCSYAEGKAIADYKKVHGVNTEPNIRQAINPAWVTYKSQIVRSLKSGYNPEQFENGTAFRQAAATTTTRTPRQTEGTADGSDTGARVIQDPMLAGVATKLEELLLRIPEGKRDEAADIVQEAIHDLSALVDKAKRRARAKTAESSETHAAAM